MTDHPDGLLAAYVDGSLAPPERAAVDEHLAGCERCREEVALALAGRSALASLPRSVGTPEDVGRAAVAEARKGRAQPETHPAAASDHPRWYRWTGAAAGVAAAILAIAIAIPSLTDGDGDSERSTVAADAGGAAEATAAAPARAIERIAGNLDATDLPGLARGFTSAAVPAPAAEDGAGEVPANAPTGTPLEAVTDRLATVTACLRDAFPPVDSDPLRVLEVRFDGTPAYAGVFFQRAGTGIDVDTFQVVVASRDGCTLLSASAVRA